ncbi:peptidoglycan DD-metalloendopeptidase family protein [Vibrio alginolyticus]|uniref:peptidoglycan DD-metalloendopeptidase family protein n=1 Tax=Vibrio alginolyticus TaxID=663 RepID=UPI0006CA99DC|nr:peptidoglycan DD-metalloendopeptidase family protein [Vibrio alginolyticus]KPM98535.1 hypothetical protein AOG25_08830 [Vibrio alginolyticus]CAH7150294.1 Peptidase_M23 domain-containing protein [Vibrio chagasii]
MQICLKETIFVSILAVSTPILVANQVSHQITVGDGYQEYVANVDESEPNGDLSIANLSSDNVYFFDDLNSPFNSLPAAMDVAVNESSQQLPDLSMSFSKGVSNEIVDFRIGDRSSYVVTQGDTLIRVLSSLGVNSSDLTTLLYASSYSQNDFLIAASNEIVTWLHEGELAALEIHKGGSSYDVYTKIDNDFEKSVEDYPSSTIEVRKDFDIKSSFSIDAIAAGLTAVEVNELARSLRYVIDFKRLKSGHKFRVVTHREIRNGKVVASSIKGVSYINKGGTENYYKFEGSYFDGDGVSVTPVFLKHPIQSDGPPLITSRFNLKRLHPILKIRRPHYGTDYGYLTGTPVVSISNSQVIYAGKKGSFGNIVKLKHPNGIITLSAHLNKIKKGITRGRKVKSGEVIGYVGSTGISTGPHLHFEMFVNGRRVDSTKVNLQTSGKVEDVDKFKLFVASIDLT